MNENGTARLCSGVEFETAPTVAADFFLRWQTAMRETAEHVRPNHWWLREEGIGVRLRRQAVHGVRGADLATN